MLICRPCCRRAQLPSIPIFGPISHKVVRPAPPTCPWNITARFAPTAPAGSPAITASSFAPNAATTSVARIITEASQSAECGSSSLDGAADE